MKRKELNIGLFGFGCVGQGLYEVLHKTPGLQANIKKICVKDQSKNRSIAPENFTFNKFDILNDPEINIVVELIDDADEAFVIVQHALQQGKAVVTANKKMVAEHFEALLELQEQYNTPILYEASCCASIPIIRNLEEYYDNDLLERIEGIVNGSTNYILTKTFAENLGYEEALKNAQELGYAETNPALDVEGYDAKYKLLILLAHAFGVVVKPEEILNIGIQNLGKLELRYAKEKGYKIKLVARARRNSDNSVTAFVAPKFVQPGDKLFQVDDVYNAVIAQTAFAENQFFVGKGAGAYPTASAVLSDISALSYDYRYEYKKLHQKKPSGIKENIQIRAFIRFDTEDEDIITGFFNQVEEIYANSNSMYVIGTLPLQELRLLIGTFPEISFILLDDQESAVQLVQNDSEYSLNQT